MDQPSKILDKDTRVITHTELETTMGMNVRPENIAERRTSARGKVIAPVGGHGGDVYWVWHEGAELMAPYSFTEFELDA